MGTIGELFDGAVRGFAARAAVVEDGERWSYAELGARVRALAGRWAAAGVAASARGPAAAPERARSEDRRFCVEGM